MLKRLFTNWTFPLYLLLLCIAAYGILSPYLGFYWDDWPMVWFAHSLGPQGYQEVFSGDRPFLAGIYILTTSVFKLVPLQWQLFGMICRWFTALVTWWTVRQLWPQKVESAAWIAILFAIYPGFKQQPISVVYSNGFLLLGAYIASIGFMLRALRQPARYWLYTIAGLITYAICMFSTEYYVGLDMLRPVLIWLILSPTIKDVRQRLKQTLRHWLPYLAMLIAFLVWRVLIFGFPTYKPLLVGALESNPLHSVLDLLNRIVQDVFSSGWLAWSQTFRFPNLGDFQLKADSLFWALVVPVAFLSWLYLYKTRFKSPQVEHSSDGQTDFHWDRQALLVGGLGMLLAGWPFWITRLLLSLEFPWDRFTLAFMLGSCIFLVGLLEWIIRSRGQRIVLMALIIAMAVGSNFTTANTYRREWLTQKDFFWQLTWRAPGLKPGTIVMTDELPLTYYSDNSLTAPLNWIYAPDESSENLPYLFAYTKVRLGEAIPALKKGLPVKQVYRNVSFRSNTSNSLVVFYSPPGCLRILDPASTSSPRIPGDLQKAVPLSNLSQILVNAGPPATPPADIFGPEPSHTWCYFYEKAELASQAGDWQTVVRMGDQAYQQHFTPAEASEYLLYIDAYGRAGNFKRAKQWAEQAYAKDANLQTPICSLLKGMLNPESQDQSQFDLVKKARQELECP